MRRSLHLEQLEDRSVPSATSFINGLYRDALLRPDAPPTSETSAWVNEVNRGVSRSTIAEAVIVSAEARARFVDDIYRTLLTRGRSMAERASWLRALSDGASRDDVTAGLLASQEYFNALGSSSNLVQSLYANVLGRTGSTAEVNSWLSALQSGLSRNGLAKGFLESAENRRLVVGEFYRTLLGRGASPAEIAGWAAHLASGTSAQRIQAGFF